MPPPLPARQTKCPDPDRLRSYASGTLNESLALPLMEHLESCQRCQRALDGLAPEDSLAAAVQRANGKKKPGDEAMLKGLIAQARQLGDTPSSLSPTDTVANKTPTGAVSLDRFVDCLSKSGLMSPLEAESMVMDMAPSDSSSLAHELTSREILTRFQARAMLKGRWKGLVLNNYVVLEPLGRGGMGRVFRARHKEMGRDVCIKVMQAEGRKSAEVSMRFQREIQMIATLNHPNIVVAHDAGQTDGIPYLAMELIEGCDLTDYVKENGPLTPSQAVPIIAQIARALDYAHNKGVIHRDIKPRNLMLDQQGHVKILDLGLAKFDVPKDSVDDEDSEPMTRTGVVMGTVDYMAPEQAINAHKADRRADIYSLGCTLFFLLTGRPMYATGSVVQRLIAHREQPIPQLSRIRADIPASLDRVFARMVAKESDTRYATMGEAADDLEQGMHGGVESQSSIPQGMAVGMVPAPPVVAPPPVSGSYDSVNESLPGLSSSTLAQGADSTSPVMVPTLPTPRPIRTRKRERTITRLVVFGILALLLWGAVYGVTNMGDSIESFIKDLKESSATWSADQARSDDPFSGSGNNWEWSDTLGASMPRGGSAVVILGPAGNDPGEYDRIEKGLREHNMSFVVASNKSGKVHAGQKKVSVKKEIADVRPEDYDVVIVCGGTACRLDIGQMSRIAKFAREESALVLVGSDAKGSSKAWK